MKTVSLKKEVYQECLTLWGDSADWSEPETAATVVMEAKIWVWEELRTYRTVLLVSLKEVVVNHQMA